MEQDKYVLMLHGFGGGPHELEPLVESLKEQGYRVFCPILAGHENIPKDLARTKYTQWLASAKDALNQIGVPSSEVVVVGFSMGGLLASLMSSEQTFKALVTINTPIDFWNLPQVLQNLSEDLAQRSMAHARRYVLAKQHSPVKAMMEFHRMLQKSKKTLEYIRCPLLVVQTKDDDTVGMRSPEYIYRHASSKDKRIAYFAKGGHGVLSSPWAAQVVQLVEEWIDQVTT